MGGAGGRSLVVKGGLVRRWTGMRTKPMVWRTIVAEICLPLGFVTGRLGVSLGGSPGTDEPLAFILLWLGLLGFGLLELLRFRRLKWI